MPVQANSKGPVLLMFSGDDRSTNLTAHLRLHGYTCVSFDVRWCTMQNVLNDDNFLLLLAEIAAKKFVAVVIAPPCAAYSVARHMDTNGPPPLYKYPDHCDGISIDQVPVSSLVEFNNTNNTRERVGRVLDTWS